MAQHDYAIENQLFPATLDDLNALFQAILTQNSGPTAPTAYAAGTPWYDTVNEVLKRRNDSNTAWETVVVTDLTAGQIAAIKEELGELALLDQVTATEIANLSINSNHLNNGAVIADKVPDGAFPLAKLSALSANVLVGRSTTSGTPAEITCTAAGRALLDDANAAAQRTTLGLGALAVMNTVGTTQVDDNSITVAKQGLENPTARVASAAVKTGSSSFTINVNSNRDRVNCTLVDDDWVEISFTDQVFNGLLAIGTNNNVRGSCIVQFRTASSGRSTIFTSQSASSLFTMAGDVDLITTPGTDGRINVAVQFNKLVIENRSNGIAGMTITLLGS